MIHPLFKYKVLSKYISNQMEYIVIRLAGISLVRFYCRPTAIGSDIIAELDGIITQTSGRAHLIGDFNARHTS